MNSIPVALFSNRVKAEPIQQRLSATGITSEIHDELRLEKLWFVPKRGAGSRIEVPGDQFERAEQLLLDWDDTENLMRDAIRCPECRSLRVGYPQFARHSLLTNLVAGLMAELGLVEKQFYCEDCHFTWPKEGARPGRNRVHTAPYYFIDGIEQTPLNRPAQSEHRKAA